VALVRITNDHWGDGGHFRVARDSPTILKERSTGKSRE
jgi:hypothetical protein